MSCLPPPPLSITPPSLSSVRAHVRAWHWRGAPLGSLRVAAGDMRAPPAPQCRGIQLWSADLVSVWTEGAVLWSNRSLLLSPRRLRVPVLHGSRRM